ncbi:hypothetical protein MPER_16157, partial [Moniliophthora perniciosa FA553]
MHKSLVPVFALARATIRSERSKVSSEEVNLGVEIARIRSQKKLLPRDKVHKRYYEKVAAIMNRCEELCDETGCWMQVSTQLPTARHGAIHFFSQRFRQEAPQGLQEVHDLTGRMYTTMIAARRKDVIQAEQEADKLRKEVQEARAAEASTLQDLTELQ